MSGGVQQFYAAVLALVVLLLTVFATAVFKHDDRTNALTDRVHQLEKRVRSLENSEPR